MAEARKVEKGEYSKQFPQVRKILAAYFHEDMFDVFEWRGNQKNYKSVIRYIKSIQDEENISKKATELKEFLRLSHDWDEDKLEDVLLKDFNGSVYAPGIGITYRKFLEDILEILEEPMERTRGEFIPEFIG